MIDDFFESLSSYSWNIIGSLGFVTVPWLWYLDEYEILLTLSLVWSIGTAIVYKIIILPLAFLFEMAYDKFRFEEKKSSLLQILILITFLHFLMLLTRSLLLPIIFKYGADEFIVNGEILFTNVAVIPIYLASIIAAVSPWFFIFYSNLLRSGWFFSIREIKAYSLTFLLFSHLAFLWVSFYSQLEAIPMSQVKGIIFLIMIIVLPPFLTYKIKKDIQYV